MTTPPPGWATFGEIANHCEALVRRLLAELATRKYLKGDARRQALDNCARVTLSTLVTLRTLAEREGSIDGPEYLRKLAAGLARHPQSVSDIVDTTSRLALVTIFQFQVEPLFKALLRDLNVPVPSGYYRIADEMVKTVGLGWTLGNAPKKHAVLEMRSGRFIIQSTRKKTPGAALDGFAGRPLLRQRVRRGPEVRGGPCGRRPGGLKSRQQAVLPR